MDAGFRVPVTGWRFGMDPLIGLVPGLGDAIGALLAAWILLEGIRLGASRATLLRIAGNIAVDAVTGAVPVIGDVFDAVWKVNLRNVALLERHVLDATRAARADRSFVVLLGAGVLALCAALAVSGALLAAALLHAVGP